MEIAKIKDKLERGEQGKLAKYSGLTRSQVNDLLNERVKNRANRKKVLKAFARLQREKAQEEQEFQQILEG